MSPVAVSEGCGGSGAPRAISVPGGGFVDGRGLCSSSSSS